MRKLKLDHATATNGFFVGNGGQGQGGEINITADGGTFTVIGDLTAIASGVGGDGAYNGTTGYSSGYSSFNGVGGCSEILFLRVPFFSPQLICDKGCTYRNEVKCKIKITSSSRRTGRAASAAGLS